jgi:hypothetical protein
LFSALLLIGCAGTKTFHELARPGDTVAVASGYKHNFQRDNITVTVTDSGGATTVYPAGDAKVRAAVNLYPDPLSSWIVTDRTGVSQTPSASDYVGQNLIHNTGGDYDWWQTLVFIDLPVTMDSNSEPMALGNATVRIETNAGPDHEVHEASVNIVSGSGEAHNFDAVTMTIAGDPGGIPFAMIDRHMQALERVPHVILSFTGTTVPYAIQVDLSHDPDQDSGGAAGDKAYISNPVGHLKSVSWHDDGINTRIIMMPNRDSDISDLKDFKVYLAGIGGWVVNDTKSFDVNGVELVSPDNVTASID